MNYVHDCIAPGLEKDAGFILFEAITHFFFFKLWASAADGIYQIVVKNPKSKQI